MLNELTKCYPQPCKSESAALPPQVCKSISDNGTKQLSKRVPQLAHSVVASAVTDTLNIQFKNELSEMSGKEE